MITQEEAQSIYMKTLTFGEEVRMSPGDSIKAREDEEKCIEEDFVTKRLIIIGGIGVTAFLPIVAQWETEGTPYEVHCAARSPKQAAYLEHFPTHKTTLYAKSRKERLCLEKAIPEVPAHEPCRTKIYCCGPFSLMKACQQRANDVGYPAHMTYFESFGGAAGGPRGEPFEADVHDLDSRRSMSLAINSEKTLLQILREAGFDMTPFAKQVLVVLARSLFVKEKYNATAQRFTKRKVFSNGELGGPRSR